MSEAQMRSQMFSLENHDLVRSWLIAKSKEERAINNFILRSYEENMTYEELTIDFKKALDKKMEIENELMKRAKESGMIS